MTWQRKREMADPFLVLQRKQERAARSQPAKAERAAQALEKLFQEPILTQDQSDAIEDLLMAWYHYERAYLPRLGAPRVSPSCRGHQASDVHRDSDDRDVMLERITAEMVGSCIDDLHYLDRAAIGVHCRNKHAGASAHKNPRIDIQHRAYQDAKSLLWPKLKAKGLVR